MGILPIDKIGVMDAITAREIDNRTHSDAFYPDPCDHCVIGDHGRCWRATCHCKHEGWVRDPNVQRPHGMAAGYSKEVKLYDFERQKKKLSKGKKGKKGKAA